MFDGLIMIFRAVAGPSFTRSVTAAAALFASMIVPACATEPSRPEEPGVRTIIAIGDLHGDYDAFEFLLTEAGLIDRRGRWSGGDTIFVQTGDIPDRGPDTRKIIEHLMKLEDQADRAGGAVIALIGNHEAMNVTGDLRYVHPGEYAAFKTRSSNSFRDNYFNTNKDSLNEFYLAKDPALDKTGVRAAFNADVPLGYLEHRRAWSPDGEIGAWVAGHDAVHIIGENLFVHGGISAAYANVAVDAINAAVRAALTSGGAGDGSILEDEAGPLWYRGNATETTEGALEIETVLNAFGIERIIVGHTPSLAGIKTLYGGRVIMIDTGISEYYGGARSYLRIEAGDVVGVSGGVSVDLE